VPRNKTTEHKEWITPGTMESISKRKYLMEECNKSRTRREKVEAEKKYKAANTEVKQKIKHDKREYYNASATKVEEAAAHGCMKFLYDTTRRLAGKFQQTSSQVKDKEGNISTSEDEQLKRWAKYFYELLNRLPPQEVPSIPEASTELNVNCGRPFKGEIVSSIKMLKAGKAACPDNIPPEALTAHPNLSSNILHSLFRKIWEEEEMPQDQNESYIVKLPKKESARTTEEYP